MGGNVYIYGKRWEDIDLPVAEKMKLYSEAKAAGKVKVRLGLLENVKTGFSILWHVLPFAAMFSSDGTLARDAIVYNALQGQRAYSESAARVRYEERLYDEGRLELLGERMGQAVAREMLNEIRREQAANGSPRPSGPR